MSNLVTKKQFNNLRTELFKRGISYKNLAELLEVKESTVSNKMNSKTEWTRKEMFTIKKQIFPNLSLDYLFEP